MDPIDIETLFGKICRPCRYQTFWDLGMKTVLTGNGRTGKHDGLEPHGVEVDNSKIASCN